jgi:hypothetical protein
MLLPLAQGGHDREGRNAEAGHRNMTSLDSQVTIEQRIRRQQGRFVFPMVNIGLRICTTVL